MTSTLQPTNNFKKHKSKYRGLRLGL